MKTSEVIVIDTLQKDQEFVVGEGEKKIFLALLTDDIDYVGDINIKINGSRADVQILGIIIGSGKQKINMYTLQDHMSPESVSDLYIKSVLFGESKLHYRGLIMVEKGAQKTNAYQKNQNLLMSKKAWADSRPELEILANDVRCTHGATVGKLDKEQLYYLQTRGLTQSTATELLLEGYFKDILERIPDEKLREELFADIQNKISTLLN